MSERGSEAMSVCTGRLRSGSISAVRPWFKTSRYGLVHGGFPCFSVNVMGIYQCPLHLGGEVSI